MARYQIQAKASIDIDEIYAAGIETWGLAQARRYLLGLHERFEFLADNPNIGINSDVLAPNLQRFRYGLWSPCCLFYQHRYRNSDCSRIGRRNGF